MILEEIIALANPINASQAQRFFKTAKGEYGEGDQFLGIRVPVLRSIAKKHLHVSDDAIIPLLKNPFHEVRLVALYIWVYQFEKANCIRQKEIFDQYLQHLESINNWDLVDTSTPQIVGVYLQKTPSEDRSFLYDFVKSNNLWKRRIAILATFAFIRKNQYQETIKISTMLLNDSHDLIHKAVGWMLREMGKRDIKTLHDFLRMHAPTMPRTMLRYAIEKLSPPERQYYLSLKP